MRVIFGDNGARRELNPVRGQPCQVLALALVISIFFNVFSNKHSRIKVWKVDRSPRYPDCGRVRILRILQGFGGS
jgi:hypothetical protein